MSILRRIIGSDDVERQQKGSTVNLFLYDIRQDVMDGLQEDAVWIQRAAAEHDINKWPASLGV